MEPDSFFWRLRNSLLVNARKLTPPLNPDPRKTRDPRRAWERLAVGLVWLDDGRKFVGCGITLEPGQSMCLLGHSLLMAPPAGAACQGRRRARRRCRGRTGVVLEEAEDDDDVPVTVDEADDDVEVDDLA